MILFVVGGLNRVSYRVSIGFYMVFKRVSTWFCFSGDFWSFLALLV